MRTLPLALVLACLGTAGTAAAAPWQPVTPPLDNLTQVGLARTPDGLLHVVWPSADRTELDQAVLAPSGSVTPAGAVVSGWSSLGNAALLADASGLRAYWSGDHTGAPDDPQHGLDVATAPLDGSAWTVAPSRIDPAGPAFDSGVAAAQSGGRSLQAYSGTVGTFVHAGFDARGGLAGEFQGGLGGCCGQDANVAFDAAGSALLAWASFADGGDGVAVQAVDPATGAPEGTPTILPHSTDGGGFTPSGTLVAVVGRAPSGFAVAYPTGYPFARDVRVWGSDGSDRLVATGSTEKPQVALAQTADRRLWVVWSEVRSGIDVVRASRSNPAGTVFGATVGLPAPASTGELYHVAGNARPDGSLDVLAHYAAADDPTATTFAGHLLPGLTVTRRIVRQADGRSVVVYLRVLDAGDPVAGARVHAPDGHAATSSSVGLIKLAVPRGVHGRHVHLLVSAAGYVDAAVTVVVPGRPRG